MKSPRPAQRVVSLIAVLAGLWMPMTAWSPQAIAATASTAPIAATARVIVKFKASSATARAQAQSATTASVRATSRAVALGTRVGIAMASGVAIDDLTQVMVASNMTSQALAARLSQDADVAYAEPDHRRHAVSVPLDPYYLAGPPDLGTSGGPASGQWYLRAPTPATATASAVASSINIESAWDAVAGAGNVVVAVLDSGVRFDHPDLGGGSGTAPGGNLLPGYDFVSNATYSGDGDGRDADPSDPGDFISDAEANSAPFLPPTVDTACTPVDPSTGRHVATTSEWHGTQTTGLIAAVTDNGVGIAGIGHNHVQVLPLRVLAKCGGTDSDIVSAMLWAGGIAVSGVPANTHPARVISMSLGSDGTCPSVYVDALAQLKAKGVMVVAAAGNGNADDKGTNVLAPANCPGVVAVAALRQAGSKVGFSNLGPEVTISAPGGNCVNINSGSSCLYPIMSTSNSGSTVPVAGDASYTDSHNAAVGTSYSTPMVAGTAALVMAANSALSADEVLAKLKGSARPFVTSGGSPGIPACADPSSATVTDGVDECYCTTALCGAGMLDASAAVAAAVGIVQARIAVSPAAPQAAQSITFSAAGSVVDTGRSIASYAWTIVDGGGIVTAFSSATNGATVTALPSAAGTFTVSVAVTDDQGAVSAVNSTVTVTAAPVVVTPTPPTTSNSGGGGGGAVGWTWLLLAPLAVATIARRRRRAA